MFIYKNLSDFRENREKLVDKGFDNYESLTKDERIWFNIELLIDAVNNGGIISHYYNYGANKNKDTIEDLSKLGYLDLADIFVQANKLFSNPYPPVDIDERNKIISSWQSEEYDEFFKQLDKKFFSRVKDLENALVQHILSNKLG